jgi:hypothetical protein
MMTAEATRKITRERFLALCQTVVGADIEIILEQARLGLRLKKAKDKSAEKVEALANERKATMAEALLALLCMKDDMTSRRKKTEEVGSVYFGFRKCSSVEVSDEAALRAWAKDAGASDVLVMPPPPPPPVATISKTALRARLDAGEEIPGVAISTDYEPFIEPVKALKDLAKKGQRPILK